jgi:hypothetical protein
LLTVQLHKVENSDVGTIWIQMREEGILATFLALCRGLPQPIYDFFTFGFAEYVWNDGESIRDVFFVSLVEITYPVHIVWHRKVCLKEDVLD